MAFRNVPAWRLVIGPEFFDRKTVAVTTSVGSEHWHGFPVERYLRVFGNAGRVRTAVHV
jgi:hypothetical protein